MITPSDVFHLAERVRQGLLELYGRFVDDVCDLHADRGMSRPGCWRVAPTLIGIHVTGKVQLTSGGRAHLLIVANFHIDPDGSVPLHVDKFELKPVGS